MKTIDKILKTTERAHLVVIANKKYWVPKKYVKDNQVNDIEFILEEFNVPKVSIHTKYEDYSEKSIKLNLVMRVDGSEKNKFMFLPKSVIQLRDEQIIIERWLWRKNCQQLIDEEIEYQKKFGDIDMDLIELGGFDVDEFPE